jgi:hypothetical protein
MAQNTPMHAHQTPDEASETLKLAPVVITLKSWDDGKYISITAKGFTSFSLAAENREEGDRQ